MDNTHPSRFYMTIQEVLMSMGVSTSGPRAFLFAGHTFGDAILTVAGDEFKGLTTNTACSITV